MRYQRDPCGRQQEPSRRVLLRDAAGGEDDGGHAAVRNRAPVRPVPGPAQRCAQGLADERLHPGKGQQLPALRRFHDRQRVGPDQLADPAAVHVQRERFRRKARRLRPIPKARAKAGALPQIERTAAGAYAHAGCAVPLADRFAGVIALKQRRFDPQDAERADVRPGEEILHGGLRLRLRERRLLRRPVHSAVAPCPVLCLHAAARQPFDAQQVRLEQDVPFLAVCQIIGPARAGRHRLDAARGLIPVRLRRGRGPAGHLRDDPAGFLPVRRNELAQLLIIGAPQHALHEPVYLLLRIAAGADALHLRRQAGERLRHARVAADKVPRAQRRRPGTGRPRALPRPDRW